MRKSILSFLFVAPLAILLAGSDCGGIPPIPWPPAPPATAYDCANPPAALKGYIKVQDPAPGYIVVLKKPAVGAFSVEDITSFSAKYAGLIQVRPLHLINGFSAQMKADLVVKLAKDPAVQYVQQNRKVKINAQPASWGLDRIDQPDLPLDWATFDPGATGKGVHFYGIDTGIDCKNADFAGRIGEAFSAVAGTAACVDGHGHGTHTAGTVGGTKYGVAKQVILHPVTVLNPEGSGTDAEVISGIDWAAKNAKDGGWKAVANMSLGGPAPAPALDQAVCNAIAAGVAFGIAGGNEGDDACTSAPANVLQALTLGAVDKTDKGASWSNYGKTCLDLWAPGVDIESDMPGGGGQIMSGTSMAAPHATGVLALYLGAHPTATVAEANAAIVAGASKDKLSGIDGPNLLLYTITKP